MDISTTSHKIFGKTFESLEWRKSETLTMLFGIRAIPSNASFPIKYLTPRAHILTKIAQLNFLPQRGH